jgi:hypothetical protein
MLLSLSARGGSDCGGAFPTSPVQWSGISGSSAPACQAAAYSPTIPNGRPGEGTDSAITWPRWTAMDAGSFQGEIIGTVILDAD